MTRSRGLSLTLDACAEEEMIRSKGFINGRTDGTRTQELDGIIREHPRIESEKQKETPKDRFKPDSFLRVTFPIT